MRGFAALLVFISHLSINLPYNFYFILGRIGVVIFFLITGYLTYASRSKRSCKKYLFNRFIRMYPTYWVLLIIGWLVFEWGELSVAKLLANVTMFQQFLGYDNILGASWMMPIQVCFFIVIGLVGIKIINNNRCTWMILIFALGSVASGALRFMTGKAFPTAFPLLINVAFIGMTLFYFHNHKLDIKIVIINVAIFEIGLLIGAMLSYDNWWAYLVAYNVGLLIFIAGYKLNVNMLAFNKLGEIGFTFFLGASIIYTILKNIGICGQNEYMTVLDVVIRFVTAIILAYVVTRFVERPLLKWSKKIEAKMK